MLKNILVCIYNKNEKIYSNLQNDYVLKSIGMPEKIDDLEAVRKLTEILSEFSKEDIERIIRWSLEKLGVDHPLATDQRKQNINPSQSKKSIKEFFGEKRPNGDVRFAVMVAYYYRFVATENEKVEEINGEILQESTRLVGRERLKKPSDTLNNAMKQGYLNKGKSRGGFTINTVGENLVAMTMPDKDSK